MLKRYMHPVNILYSELLMTTMGSGGKLSLSIILTACLFVCCTASREVPSTIPLSNTAGLPLKETKYISAPAVPARDGHIDLSIGMHI